jgi:hypothetical protein
VAVGEEGGAAAGSRAALEHRLEGSRGPVEGIILVLGLGPAAVHLAGGVAHGVVLRGHELAGGVLRLGAAVEHVLGKVKKKELRPLS